MTVISEEENLHKTERKVDGLGTIHLPPLPRPAVQANTVTTISVSVIRMHVSSPYDYIVTKYIQLATNQQ
jgi:hypothetical protein